MSRQRYDHSEVIDGELRQLRSTPNAASAAQVVLDQGPRKLLLAQALHIQHSDGSRGFTLRLLRFGKDRNSDPFAPAVFINLEEAAAAGLLRYLQQQDALREVRLGSPYVIAQSEALSPEAAQTLTDMLARGDLDSAAVASIYASSQHAAYKAALAELRGLLPQDDREATYQAWFVSQPWVFGTNYTGPVDKRSVGLHEQVDIIMETADGYLDIVELKKPSADVLRYDRSRRVWCWSAGASETVAQCANYLRTVEENRHRLELDEGLRFVKPRARIVMGRSNQWERRQHDALRTLNAALHGIEIWTYDHVLSMGARLVACYEREPSDYQADDALDDDDPFGDQ